MFYAAQQSREHVSDCHLRSLNSVARPLAASRQKSQTENLDAIKIPCCSLIIKSTDQSNDL